MNQKKIGLSLRGGGAKTASYIGLLKAFEENNIKVNMIVGSSGGAIVGAMLALGKSIEEMRSAYEQVRFTDLLGLESIKGLIIDENNAFTELKSMIGDNLNFEDCRIPIFIQVTSLRDGRSKILSKGDLSKSVYASSAIPTFAKPFEMDGELFMDGDITAGYAADFLREQGAEVVIGSNCQDDRHLTGYVEPLTRTGNALITAFEALREKDLELHPVDLMIGELGDPDISILEFEHVDHFIEIGYKHTIEKIEQIKELVFSE